LQGRYNSTLVKASVGSLNRVATARSEVVNAMKSSPVRESVERVVKPKSLAKGMRTIGVALVAAPDPLTDIAAVALFASSIVVKRREPASLTNLALETRKLMREFQSLRL
jgi:hypothetical protein